MAEDRESTAIELALERLRGAIDLGLEKVEGKLNLLLQRADQVDARLEDHYRRIENNDSRIDSLEKAVVTRDDMNHRTRQTIGWLTVALAVIGAAATVAALVFGGQ